MTGVRPGSFSNEHRMKCHTHAIGDRDGDEQPRGVHAPALGSGACSSPVVFLLPRLLSAFSFSRNADFMGVFGREAIKFPVLYRDSKAKTLEMQTAVALSQIGKSKKALDLLPLDTKTNPGIHPLWRL
jgi:hypothetical protein